MDTFVGFFSELSDSEMEDLVSSSLAEEILTSDINNDELSSILESLS